MLTVKVHRYKHEKSDDGLCLRREIILSATKVLTDYWQDEEGYVTHLIVVHTPDGQTHSFDLKWGTSIYVENMNRETVQVYSDKSLEKLKYENY
jgi:hypothetical protein